MKFSTIKETQVFDRQLSPREGAEEYFKLKTQETQEELDPEAFTQHLTSKTIDENTRLGAEKLKSILKGKSSTPCSTPVVLTFEPGVMKEKKPLKTEESSDTSTTLSLFGANDSVATAPIEEEDARKFEFDQYVQELGGEKPGTQIRNYNRSSKKSMTDKEFVTTIEELLAITQEMAEPRFKFEATAEAAAWNFKLLRDGGFGWDNLLNTNPKSVTSFGSEFKDPQDLDRLFSYHPRWKQLRHRLHRAVHFPLEDLEEELRLADLKAAYKRGNHKSADKNAAFLAEAVLKEIHKGWGLPLPDDSYLEIPELIINPMGVQNHIGVMDDGTFDAKLRNTHDLSWLGEVSKTSVNSRVKKDEMLPCMFGHCFLRIIHFIVHMRYRHPK